MPLPLRRVSREAVAALAEIAGPAAPLRILRPQQTKPFCASSAGRRRRTPSTRSSDFLQLAMTVRHKAIESMGRDEALALIEATLSGLRHRLGPPEKKLS